MASVLKQEEVLLFCLAFNMPPFKHTVAFNRCKGDGTKYGSAAVSPNSMWTALNGIP